MKSLYEEEWELVGKCLAGLVFISTKHNDEFVVVKRVRFVRRRFPDVFIAYTNNEVTFEFNHEKVVSTSDITALRLVKLVESSKEELKWG